MFSKKINSFFILLISVSIFFISCQPSVDQLDKTEDTEFYFYLTDSKGKSYVMSETSGIKGFDALEAVDNGTNIFVRAGTTPAFMTMTKEEDDSYVFVCNNKFLTCPKTGNGLSFETEKSEYSYWVLEAVEGKENSYFIKSKNAFYKENPQYVEYYSSFTTYGFNSSKAEIYTITLKAKKTLNFAIGYESFGNLHDSGVVYKVESENVDPAYTETEYAENNALLFGNPSKATKNHLYSKNYLLERDQYTLSYNNRAHIPNWVAWHLVKEDMGAISRSNDFRADLSLPQIYYKVADSDFKFSSFGFDRGHMCPSGERTSDSANNSATFFMSNMVPQTGENNQKTWMNLEHYLQEVAKNEDKEVYIISGPAGIGGSSAKGSFEYISLNSSLKIPSDDKGIVVPASTWKIALILETGENDISRVTKDSTIIAVNMPNTVDCHNDAVNAGGFGKEYKITYNPDDSRIVEILNPEEKFCWEYYATTVDEIEELTGFDFFANLDDEIEDVLENKKYSSNK